MESNPSRRKHSSSQDCDPTKAQKAKNLSAQSDLVEIISIALERADETQNLLRQKGERIAALEQQIEETDELMAQKTELLRKKDEDLRQRDEEIARQTRELEESRTVAGQRSSGIRGRAHGVGDIPVTSANTSDDPSQTSKQGADDSNNGASKPLLAKPLQDRANNLCASRFVAHPIFGAWPRQAVDATVESSAINCAVMVLRHLNSQSSNDSLMIAQIENEHNLIQQASMDQNFPTVGADAHKKLLDDLRAGGLIATDVPPTFADLVESTQMLATIWSRREQLLFCTFKKVGAENWKFDPEYDAEHGAKQSTLEIEQFGDLVPKIEEHCTKVSPITEEPDSYRIFKLRPPRNIRVQYTPGVGKCETISTLQSFRLKLDRGSSAQYILTAAVRARDPRDEGDFDRVRIFKISGYDYLPPQPYPYADGDWMVGHLGHTYHLYYTRCDREFVDLSEADRGRIRQHHFKEDPELQAWDESLKKLFEKLRTSAPPRLAQTSNPMLSTPGPVSSQQSTQSSRPDYYTPTPQRGPRQAEMTPRTPKSQPHYDRDQDRWGERVYREPSRTRDRDHRPSFSSSRDNRDSARTRDRDDRESYASGRDRDSARTRGRDERDDTESYASDRSPKRRRVDQLEGQRRGDFVRVPPRRNKD